ncbi:MAG: DUF2431 domain-containing protein [Gammaproteobacteria bacterium]|nr:DUF2431 domain-containing protein [Gammaproteobacteria bacterium]
MSTSHQKPAKGKKEPEEKKGSKKSVKVIEDESENEDEESEKKDEADEAEDADDESDNKEEDSDDELVAPLITPLSEIQIAARKKPAAAHSKKEESAHEKKAAKSSKKAENDDTDSDDERKESKTDDKESDDDSAEVEVKVSAKPKKHDADDSEKDESESEEESEDGSREEKKEAKAKPKHIRYKKRLVVGDGNFTFTEGMLKKHEEDCPGLAKAITATELLSEEKLTAVLPDSFPQRIASLKEQGVKVHFEIDATKIDQKQKALEPRRYKRIHFNCPQLGAGTGSNNYQDRKIPKMLKAFFASAAKIQKTGDRIHMVLPRPGEYGEGNRKFRQAGIYGIFAASAKAGYVLIAKHKFVGDEGQRYTLYEHMITGKSASADVTESSREYIFKKTKMTYEQIRAHSKYGAGGLYNVNIKGVMKRYSYLNEPKTDDGSSSYVESDTDDNSSDDQNCEVKQPEVKKNPAKGPSFFQPPAPAAASSSNSSAGIGKSVSSNAGAVAESKAMHIHH